MTNEMTAQGLDNLKKQLDKVRAQLKEVAQRIKEARDLGDLSENAEYIEAKNEQAFLLGKEYELDQKIKSARVVRRCSGDTVTVGCKVGVNNGKMAAVFEIVGSDEADPLNGRISPDSPIGGALCGHRVGDKISVKTPAGMSEYVITKID